MSFTRRPHPFCPAATTGVRRRGSVVMEAALVLPILIVLVFGAIEFGYAFYVKHTLQGAAREGARAGIVPGADNAAVTAAVTTAMQNAGVANSTYTVSIRSPGGGAVAVSTVPAGQSFVVEVAAPWSQFSVMFGRAGGYLGGDLRGRSVMRREG